MRDGKRKKIMIVEAEIVVKEVGGCRKWRRKNCSLREQLKLQ